MVAAFLILYFVQQSVQALKLTAPSSYQSMMGEDVTIPCSFTVNTPPINLKFLAITWNFQGKEILRVQNAKVTAQDPRVSYAGRAEDGIADLSVSNITIADGGIYVCSVLYTPKREEKEVRLEIQAQPQIAITDKLVLKNKESSLSSAVSGFYPVDIDIKWLRDGEILNNILVGTPQRTSDGTYSVRSSVKITPTEEDRGQNFSCRVQHESLTSPLQEDFQLVYGEVPSVNLTYQEFRLNVAQDLVCSASEFYPESITVNWLLNGTLLENVKTRRISSSAVESVYHFLPTPQNWGKELACVVDHPTLTSPHIERLLVHGKDLKAQYKKNVASASAFLILSFGVGTIVLFFIKQRRKRFPKVRHITRSTGGTFSLDVDHFYPEDISVSWEVIQPPSPQSCQISSTITMHQNQNGTFNATITCESLRGMIQENEPYTVQAVVEHKKLRHPSHREWRSNDRDTKGFFVRPEVDTIQIRPLFVGQQTQLQCRVLHFYPDELTVCWLKKESSMEKLHEINDNGKYRILKLKSQFLPNDKTFNCTALLEVTPSLEDQGSEIICRVSHPSLGQPIERTTGALHVLVTPKVQRPVQLLMNDSGDITGTFGLFSFYPKDIRIAWRYGPTQEKKPSQETLSDNDDGTLTVASLCTIPGNLFEDPQFRVRVTWEHPSMKEPEHREISVQDPDFPWRPKLEEFPPFILQANQENTVMANITGYFPTNLKVTWLEKRGESVTDCAQSGRYKRSDLKHERTEGDAYRCSPSLSFTPSAVTEDVELICRVDHPSLTQPIEKRVRPRLNMAPKMNDVVFTICDPDHVKCVLNLVSFYPQKISITWTHEENATHLPATKKIIQTDEKRIFEAVSECVIPWRYLESSVRVTWEHESLTKPEYHDLRITDLLWRPNIEHISLDIKECKVWCTISGYFPKNLTVRWYKKNKEGDDIVPIDNDKKYTMSVSEDERQSDNTYSSIASLVAPSLLKDQKSVIICKVEHPSLKEPIEKRTEPTQFNNKVECLIS